MLKESECGIYLNATDLHAQGWIEAPEGITLERARKMLVAAIKQAMPQALQDALVTAEDKEFEFVVAIDEVGMPLLQSLCLMHNCSIFSQELKDGLRMKDHSFRFVACVSENHKPSGHGQAYELFCMPS